jgi:hypothetical protein
MEQETITVVVYARTKYIHSRDEYRLEVDKEEWKEMSEEDRDLMCEEVMHQQILEWGYEVEE